MNLEAFRRGLRRLAISSARLDLDRGLPRRAELLSKDAPPADPRPPRSSAARWTRSTRDRRS